MDGPLVKGLMEEDPENKVDLVKYQIESAWNLSQWKVVEESCPQTNSTDWQTNLGKILLFAKKDDEKGDLVRHQEYFTFH